MNTCTTTASSLNECEADYDVLEVNVSRDRGTCAVYMNKDSEEKHVRCFGNGKNGMFGTYSNSTTFSDGGDDSVQYDNLDLGIGKFCYTGYSHGFCETQSGKKVVSNEFNYCAKVDENNNYVTGDSGECTNFRVKTLFSSCRLVGMDLTNVKLESGNYFIVLLIVQIMICAVGGPD